MAEPNAAVPGHGQDKNLEPPTVELELKLVVRLTASLRPHPAYDEVCGPLEARRVRRVSQRPQLIREPLLVTTGGTILDGHARWRAAMESGQLELPCLECDVTEEDALRTVVERHRAPEGLNDYARILLALHLESHFKALRRAARGLSLPSTESSNLTKDTHKDVRQDIARLASVSAGNVTKVKQIQELVVPEIRNRLLRGEVSIHRAWEWRTLDPKVQRDAVWEHLHGGAIKRTVKRLIQAHVAAANPPTRSAAPADRILSALHTCDPATTVVAIVDVPGSAVAITQELCDKLLGGGER